MCPRPIELARLTFSLRIAHRLRDIQQLPYVVVSNPHLSLVYELYYKAFERFRAIPEIRTLEDNDGFCDILRTTLKEHLVAIPKLAMGVLECRGLLPPEVIDEFMKTLLRAVRTPSLCCSSISRLIMVSIENLSPRYCRAAPSTNGNVQLSMALPWLPRPHGYERRLCGRSLLKMQRKRGD